MKQPPLKQIFVKKVIVFAVPAFLTAWLYNVIIGDILFTTCALFGFLRYPIYYLLTGAVFFLIPATAFRISKENNGNEKREYLRLMSGKDFDLAEAKVMRKNDKLQLCEFFAFAVAELIACVWDCILRDF